MVLFTILVLSALLPLAYAGWGRALFRLFKLDTDDLPRTFSVWVGWIALLVFWQALHLVLPLTAWVVIPALIMGWILLWLFRKSSPEKHQTRSVWLVLMVVLLLALWFVVSVRVLDPPTSYDAGLYYEQVLAWYTRFRAVPGLGNLHGRLAFNHAWFIYVAALNFHPWSGAGWILTTVTLFMMVAGTLAELLLPALRKPSLWKTAHPYRYSAPLLMFPLLVYFALRYSVISSPTPDFASHMLQIMMFTLLCVGVGRWSEGERDLNSLAVVTALIAATAVTIKLSNAMFALVSLAFVAAYFWNKREKRLVLLLLVCIVLIGMVWGAHGYILSGMPLYPSTLGRLPFDWSVPREAAREEARYIYAWARQPEAPTEQVLANRDWFMPWLKHVLSYKVQVVFPLATALLTGALALGDQLRRREKSMRLVWALYIPLLLSLIYWFITAPDTRFAMTLFYLLPVQGVLLCMHLSRDWLNKLPWQQGLALGVLGGCLLLLIVGGVPIVLHSPNIWTYALARETTVTARKTDSGLVVHVPTYTDQCWGADLPCTPNFNAELRLRVPDDLSKGFTVH